MSNMSVGKGDKVETDICDKIVPITLEKVREMNEKGCFLCSGSCRNNIAKKRTFSMQRVVQEDSKYSLHSPPSGSDTLFLSLKEQSMVYLQHRSQTQEVDSNVSQSRSLQPGSFVPYFCQFKILPYFFNFFSLFKFVNLLLLPTWFMLIVQCFTKVSSQTCQ